MINTAIQADAYIRIRALVGLNSFGGPGVRHLEQIALLPVRDRARVLQAFADDVHINLSVDERLGIAAACKKFELQATAIN